MDVTVCVATCGDLAWARLAHTRAIPSAAPQAPVVHVHGQSLHEARNTALGAVRTPWVAFLDADDELAPDYMDRMAEATADLRAPAVQYVRDGHPRPAYVPKVAGHTHACTGECVASGAGNWIVVGAVVRTELVRDAGGWHDWPVYEDFDLWMRLLRAGASVEAIPAAVYIAHARPDSRNRAPAMAVKNATHHAIVAACS